MKAWLQKMPQKKWASKERPGCQDFTIIETDRKDFVCFKLDGSTDFYPVVGFSRFATESVANFLLPRPRMDFRKQHPHKEPVVHISESHHCFYLTFLPVALCMLKFLRRQ